MREKEGVGKRDIYEAFIKLFTLLSINVHRLK